MKKRDLAVLFLSVFLILTFLMLSTGITPATAAEKPQYGGILKIITTGGIVNLGDPSQRNGFNDGSYRMPIVEELIKFDFEGKGNLIPWLATSWEYNPDYTTLTFKLRKGVKFHDGTDFNAAAAKFSLDLVLNSTMVQLKKVSSIDVIDDYTIRLNLIEFDAGLLRNLASYTCPMISPTSFDKEKSKMNPVGTGPFKFISYDRDVLLKVVKFNDYWQTGKPYLDGIEFIFIADAVTRVAALKAGEAHVLRIISPSDGADLKASSKYDLFPNEMAVDALACDSIYPESPYHDIKVRRAIAHAIDNKAVAKACGFGFFPPANQMFSQNTEAYNPAIKGYPYDPKKAKELLSEAGYPNGFETKLTYRPGAFEADFCTMIQSYLAQIGIKVKLAPVEPGLFSKLRREGWKDSMMFYVMPMGIEKEMSHNLRDRLSRNSATYNNSIYYPDDYMEKLLKINSERDDAKRKRMLQEVGKMAIDDYCLVIPVQVEMAVSAHNKQVRDLNIFKYYGMNWHPARAWLAH